MKKNANYVGVDEKYIPEEEKYVDNETNEELKNTVNDGMRSFNNYITDKNNQEKIKTNSKKGLKILKNFGIGYLVFVGIVIILVISIFTFVIVNMTKMIGISNDIREKNNTLIDKEDERINRNSFNKQFEMYSGSKTGVSLKSLLDDVITNNKKELEHIITVTQNETTTSTPDKIIELKQKIEDFAEYEISLDYNKDGYVNKVNIK